MTGDFVKGKAKNKLSFFKSTWRYELRSGILQRLSRFSLNLVGGVSLPIYLLSMSDIVEYAPPSCIPGDWGS